MPLPAFPLGFYRIPIYYKVDRKEESYGLSMMKRHLWHQVETDEIVPNVYHHLGAHLLGGGRLTYI